MQKTAPGREVKPEMISPYPVTLPKTLAGRDGVENAGSGRLMAPERGRLYWDSLDEEDLIASCRAGNNAAWEALLRRYRGSIYRYAWSLCHNQADADDLTSLTLLRIYQYLPTYRNQAAFVSWAFRITYNLYIDQYVRPIGHKLLSLDTGPVVEGETIEDEEAAGPAFSPEAVCLDHAAVQEIAHTFDHLPADLRASLGMHLLGYSYERIASRLGIALGTVKSRIHRARAM